MKFEAITNKQAGILAIIFVMTNSFSVLYGVNAGQDLWISYLLATVAAGLLWLLMSGMMNAYPEMNFFTLLDRLLGKFLGRTVSVVLLLFAFLSLTTSVINFGKFTQLTALSKTPQIILPALIILIAVWVLHSGIEVLARCGSLLIFFIAFVFLYFLLFGVEFVELENLTPVMEDGLFPVVHSSIMVFVHQFGQSVLLLALYHNIKRKDSHHPKGIAAGVLIGGAAVTLIALSTLATLGQAETASEFYPVFTVLSIRNVGGFIQHMEILTSLVMAFFVFFRIALGLYFICSALTHLFNLPDYRSSLLPMGLLILSATQLLFWNAMDLRATMESDLSLRIAFPLLFILPVILAIIARARRKSLSGNIRHS